MASALPRNHMAVANKQPRSNPRRDSVAPSFTAGQTRSLSTTRSAFRDCRRRLSIAYAASAVDTEKPYLKCVNPFRDEWVLVKGGESLGTEFRDINNYLLEAGVGPSDAVKPKDVQRLVVDEGYTLVDVRIQWSYDEWNLDYAVHMPLLRTIEGNDPAKIWRRFGHALFVEFPPVESNFPNWLEGMFARFNPEDKILFACNLGGLLDRDPVRAVPSSSFEAMYFLKNAGYKNVKYVQGGICAWRASSHLVESSRGVRENLPWFKTAPGIKGFFPAPCDWTHVRRCACDDEVDGCSC